jgi:hypothetical protein
MVVIAVLVLPAVIAKRDVISARVADVRTARPQTALHHASKDFSEQVCTVLTDSVLVCLFAVLQKQR